MADLTESEAQHPRDPRLQRALALYTRVDNAIFAVEAAIVSAATALMTIFIFLDITFTFANGIRVRLLTEAGRAGGLEVGRIVALGLAATLLMGLVVAGLRAHPRLGKTSALRQAAFVVGFGVATFGLVVLLVWTHPRVTCLTLVGLGSGYAWLRLRRAVSEGHYGRRAWVIWALSTALLAAFAATVPDRYSSWTQPYALFLLLWTGFIGASMATSRGRHLKIDAVRKAIPKNLLGRYNFLSYFLAALFTALFCYLAVRYTLARFDNPHTAREIPDWLKVLAIPVSLFFVTFRFTARAVLCLMGYVEPATGEAALLAQPEERE